MLKKIQQQLDNHLESQPDKIDRRIRVYTAKKGSKQHPRFAGQNSRAMKQAWADGKLDHRDSTNLGKNSKEMWNDPVKKYEMLTKRQTEQYIKKIRTARQAQYDWTYFIQWPDGTVKQFGSTKDAARYVGSPNLGMAYLKFHQDGSRHYGKKGVWKGLVSWRIKKK